jgi:diguanylate cyclase (GGDEF)-like protein
MPPPPSQAPLALLEETLHELQQPRRYARLFAQEMEEEFQQARLPFRIAHYREAMVLGIILFNAFLGVDYFCIRPQFVLSLVIRLAVNTPLALIAYFAISRVGRGMREMLFASSAIPATVCVLYLYRGTSELMGAAQATLILMMLFAANALRPDFRHACVAIPFLALSNSLYLAASPGLQTPVIALYIGLGWATAGLALRACYGLELEERIAYLLRMRNEAQNAELARINTELAHLSLIDTLTGIPNRRSFNNQFRSAWDRALRRKQFLSVLMMDVDHFKVLNDRFGHPYGDTVLSLVARALGDTLRAECDMVARYGGEEFIALLPNQTLANARAIAERLCAAVREIALPPPQPGVQEHVTISIGVAAMLPTAKSRGADLLRAADVALYKAKARGRNCVFPSAA